MEAAMLVTVEVTQDDINRGIRASSCNCPVANALTRQGYTNVMVEAVAEFEDNTGHKFIATLPEDVRDAIAEFDYQGVMFPMKFTINALDTTPDYGVAA